MDRDPHRIDLQRVDLQRVDLHHIDPTLPPPFSPPFSPPFLLHFLPTFHEPLLPNFTSSPTTRVPVQTVDRDQQYRPQTEVPAQNMDRDQHRIDLQHVDLHHIDPTLPPPFSPSFPPFLFPFLLPSFFTFFFTSSRPSTNLFFLTLHPALPRASRSRRWTGTSNIGPKRKSRPKTWTGTRTASTRIVLTCTTSTRIVSAGTAFVYITSTSIISTCTALTSYLHRIGLQRVPVQTVDRDQQYRPITEVPAQNMDRDPHRIDLHRIAKLRGVQQGGGLGVGDAGDAGELVDVGGEAVANLTETLNLLIVS